MSRSPQSTAQKHAKALYIQFKLISETHAPHQSWRRWRSRAVALVSPTCCVSAHPEFLTRGSFPQQLSPCSLCANCPFTLNVEPWPNPEHFYCGTGKLDRVCSPPCSAMLCPYGTGCVWSPRWRDAACSFINHRGRRYDGRTDRKSRPRHSSRPTRLTMKRNT